MSVIIRCLPLTLVCAALLGQTAPQPNIVLFLSDDLRWHHVGFNGGTAVPTPNIDRIASEGVKLTQFYVQPVCSPTRASLLTGRYAWKNGMNIRPPAASTHGMPLDERTIAEALQDVGYATWMVGKWHLGHWKRPHLPLQRGFDHHYGHYGGWINSFTLKRGRSLDWHRNGNPVIEKGYSTFLMASEATSLIERHDGASPFFLYLAFNAPHSPHKAPDEYLAKYGEPSGGESQKAQVECMDLAVGQVIEALERKGVLGQTLVMFMNDNGGPLQTSNGSYSGSKGSYQEGGVRVPAALRWPEQISAGSVSDEMLHVVDLFPTFARLTGASTDSGLPLDGLDAWDTIANGATSPREEIAFALDAIRVGDWKLIEEDAGYSQADQPLQLFNIRDDPYEETNLVSDRPDKLTELRARLASHQQFARTDETIESIPDYPPAVLGEEEESEFGQALGQWRRTEVSIAAVTSLVTEGTAAAFSVTLKRAAAESLAVAVSVAESGSALSGTPPATVTFATGDTSATLTVPTQSDTVPELDSVVTATVIAGTGYSVGSQATASVTVQDDDSARFTVSASPETIAEGESATLTVAISNGVTYAADQTITLAVTGGTAVADDYSLATTGLTLAARATTVTAALAALADQTEEAAETVTVGASLGGVSIGSATVTINSISHDATLSALSLSGIDIGTFASGTAAYAATVAQDVSSTTVTATASHAKATAEIAPGAEVSLAEGANEITVTVTAEDGTTTQTYTVTATRAGPPLPVVSIVAVESTVTEGERAEFRVSRAGPAAEALTVALTAGSTPYSMRFSAGRTSWTGYTSVDDDEVVEDDITIRWEVQEGDGYTVSPEAASAEVVIEDNDVAEFALSVDPAEIAEGASTTVRVSTTNGVTFAEDQAIALDFAGSTATEGSDFTVSPGSLTLPARARSATATLTASGDSDVEGDETVSVSASHGDTAIGTAAVTIADSEVPALTAQFAEMPETHDGETGFWFELHFSEEIRISYLTFRDEAFEVTGGAITRARRATRGSSLRWELRAKPASDADVVLVLPVTVDCEAVRAVCTAGGKPLSSHLEATVRGPGPESSGEFSLAPENSSPSGIWSNGETAWVADLDDARLYAYQRGNGERLPGKDIATGRAPMGLWSDGETLWVAGLGGGLRAHRVSDGLRLPAQDLALGASAAPGGVWSDGETAWVSEWLGDTVHAYRLSDGQREAGRDIELADGNLMPVGLWSDGETLWVADWRERLYAYRLTDGGREPSRDVIAGAADTDPTGLWSDDGTLLSTGWDGSEVRAYRLPALAGGPGKGRDGFLPARAASLAVIADPALRVAIGTALEKVPGEAVTPEELAGLETLEARNGGIRDLSGIEGAVGLKELDLGFNPLADLRPLVSLPALESLNLDGTALDVHELVPLAGLKRLSLRHNGIEDLGALAGLTSLIELDVGDNRIADLRPLAGLTNLAVLQADRNHIADLWPLASLVGLEALELGANRFSDLQPLAGMVQLRALRLGGNDLAQLYPLSGLEGLEDLGLADNAVEDLRALSELSSLRRLDLRGNAVDDLRPLAGLPSLVWIHVGGSRIKDLAPLDGMPGLTVAGRDDLEPPSGSGRGNERASRK